MGISGEGLGTLELDTEWGEERVSGVQRWRRASNLQTLGKYEDIYPAALKMYSRLPPQMHYRIQVSIQYQKPIRYVGKPDKMTTVPEQHLVRQCPRADEVSISADSFAPRTRQSYISQIKRTRKSGTVYQYSCTRRSPAED